MSRKRKTKHNDEKKLTINFSVKSVELTDATVPISWCISKDLFEKLKRREAKNPCLLIVGVDVKGKKEVFRKIVPIDQALDYIMFSGKGKHKLLSRVVWHNDGDVNALKKYFLSQYARGGYDINVMKYGSIVKLRSSEDMSFRARDGIRAIGEGSITLNVPEQFFAKEPSERVKWVVNLWHSYAPTDQCNFRKRCIMAIPKIPLVLLWIVSLFLLRAICALFFSLSGVRKIKWSAIIHPFDEETLELFEDSSHCFEGRSMFILALAPCLPIAPIIVFLGLLTMRYFWLDISLGRMAIETMATVGSLSLLVIATIITLVTLKLIIFSLDPRYKFTKEDWTRWRIRKSEDERIRISKQKEREAIQRQYELDLSKFVCPTDVRMSKTQPPKLRDLAWQNRTIYLRFWDLKRKVCRPFSRY